MGKPGGCFQKHLFARLRVLISSRWRYQEVLDCVRANWLHLLYFLCNFTKKQTNKQPKEKQPNYNKGRIPY